MYKALENGEEVFRGTYEECLKAVGVCTEYGWELPEWKDCGIIEVGE